MKDAPKRASAKKATGPSVSLALFPGMSDRTIAIGAAVVALAAAAGGVLFVLAAASATPGGGYPMDDAWIPLTFAKNLRISGLYSYFQNEMVTSGSTSPLYVFLLAALGFLAGDPLVLTSIIGIASFAAAAWLLVRIGAAIFRDEPWLGLVAGALFVLTPRMQAASASGVPTMLYTALVLAAVLLYLRRRSVAFFVFAGLALWVRPDALVFIIAALLHLIWHHRVAKQAPEHIQESGSQERRVAPSAARAGALVYVILVLAYFAFNEILSGSLFPNSVAAKIAYYGGVENPPFIPAVMAYFTGTTGAALITFVGLGLLFGLADLARRRALPVLMPMLILLGTVLVYGLFLPFLFDDGRYLAPAMPFFLLLGIWGIRRTFAELLALLPVSGIRTAGNAIAIALFALAAIMGLAKWSEARREYGQAVKYIADRHVAAGVWLATYAPKFSAVATHVPGAIGYHSSRRILDMTGIVTPEVIPSIGNLADLQRWLRGSKVAYIAALRERFEIVNQNPVFTTDARIPEVMEIFNYDPSRTHVMAQRASALNRQAAQLMQRQLNAQAVNVLLESYRLDPLSARTSTLLGVCLLTLGDTAQASSFLQQAIEYQKDYAPAMVPLGDIATNRKEFTTALGLLRKAVALNPQNSNAKKSYNRAAQLQYEDSLARMGFRRMQYTVEQ